MTALELGAYSPEACAVLATHAVGLRSLMLRGDRWFEVSDVRALDLRQLTTFACYAAYEVQDYSWWHGFDALRVLRVEPFNVGTLVALAAAPWCNQLESVELSNLFGDTNGQA